jgi:hypothetical protein
VALKKLKGNEKLPVVKGICGKAHSPLYTIIYLVPTSVWLFIGPNPVILPTRSVTRLAHSAVLARTLG